MAREHWAIKVCIKGVESRELRPVGFMVMFIPIDFNETWSRFQGDRP